MAISKESRRSGPYVGTGTVKTYPFDFLMRNAEYVAVYQSVEGSIADRKLGAQEFSVTLNPDQENNPGGTVTLDSALANGVNLSIVSEVPYTQNLVLTNKGGFYPESINDAEDERVIQIQQLYEALQRCVSVPVTSLTTREELLQQLMDVAATANEYADLAEKTYQEVLKTRQEIDGLQPKIETAIAVKGEEAVAAVVAEGDVQVERLQGIADSAEALMGVAGGERTWRLASNVAAGSTITIPQNLRYVVGRHHLRIAWNGLVLAPTENFNEVGNADEKSVAITLTFDAKAGDLMNAWVGALGSGNVDEALATAVAAEQAIADLSRQVVYKE